MPNIATALKAEISRVARKEVRSETSQLKKTASRYRTEIAALKKSVADLQRQLGRQGKALGAAVPNRAAQAPSARDIRFSAKGFAALRQKLGLSARELAVLLDVSQLSVYKWEQGKARPRAKQLAAISELRSLGKKDAAIWVSQLQG